MNDSLDLHPSSPIPQQVHSRPPHSTSTTHLDGSPSTGRQRVRTEPSPRHQPASSGWLGPYNEQPSPAAINRSPRTRLGHSPTAAGRADRDDGSHGIHGTHRALGWQLESSAGSEVFRRREFDPKQGGDQAFPGPLMEPSNSVQSLVESIDDDHVFKLTEMTKKRVEHNNPTQKRQRVVSLPTSEVSLASFHPSEKTLQFSNSCKASMEAHYALVFQAIEEGRPLNRLQKLREILPRIKPVSLTKTASECKIALDAGHSGHSRSRRLKGEKYRFVDKVEESSCIWDVDHMEAKANAEAQAAAEALAAAKQHSTLDAEPLLEPVHPHHVQQQTSGSSESFAFDNSWSADSYAIPPSSSFTSRPLYDSPAAGLDQTGYPMGMSPSSTLSSLHHQPPRGSSSHSLVSGEPTFQHHTEGSKLRFVESHPSSALPPPPPVSQSHFQSLPSQQALPPQAQAQSQPSILSSTTVAASGPSQTTPTIVFANGAIESALPEVSPSKRNSFLGLFGVRGKKVGQDSDHTFYHDPPPISSAFGSPRLTPTYERRSFDSHQNLTPYPTQDIMNPSSADQPISQELVDSQGNRRMSLEEPTCTFEAGEPINAHMTDDELGAWAPAGAWPQGERMEDSQDESDPTAVTLTSKRSSLRRFTEKMMWKRGNKALSAISSDPQSPGATGQQQQGKPFSENKSLGKKTDPSIAYLQQQNINRLSASQPSSSRNSLEISARPKYNIRGLSSNSSPVLEAIKSPDAFTANSPRGGPLGGATHAVPEKSPMLSGSRPEKSPMLSAVGVDKSPMLKPTRNERSPMLGPISTFSGEDFSNHSASQATDLVKPLPLMVEVDRIPKRLLERVKARPELAGVDWSAESVDLSPLLKSSEPLPTYDEYIGISAAVKQSNLYPAFLDNVDVLNIHMTIGQEESKDAGSKNRARKWDMLELRMDLELDSGEKWIKETMGWSRSKADTIERHRRAEDPDREWHLEEGAPLVAEPEEEEGLADADQSRPDASQVRAFKALKNKQTPHIAPLETLKARKKQRELSLTSAREMGGSMSSLHTSLAVGFKASLESTRESILEMKVYLHECQQRLEELKEATGEHLREKEPVFKEIVDRFTTEWNKSYFVSLKDVEDKIQVMNLKRIENPWMDMLLIMLSWFIRGLFYMVEGVTIMIIVARHAWGKAKKGYGVVRNARREQGRLNQGGEVRNDLPKIGDEDRENKSDGHPPSQTVGQEKLIGAWS